MIDIKEAKVALVVIHKVGNATNDEDLKLSEELTNIESEDLKEVLVKYFLSHFNYDELNQFTFSNGGHELNPLYNYSKNIFEDEDAFIPRSADMAKHLYEVAVHPNIKSGEFYVALFTGILVDGQPTEAVGIFKSEKKEDFLRITEATSAINVKHNRGINTTKLDKGALILNTHKDEGYMVAVKDASNRLFEAVYWVDTFLNVKPLSDSYNNTKEYMNLTKDFITKEFPKNYEVEKSDQIDLLNRSMDYFKHADEFNEEDFGMAVFQDKNVANDFRRYTEETYEGELEPGYSFEISAQAVKKQQRIFKSILKLDKNFSVYIHGDKNLIEKGYDEVMGKKFYKIYYDEER